jgi:hypothetical protein
VKVILLSNQADSSEFVTNPESSRQQIILPQVKRSKVEEGTGLQNSQVVMQFIILNLDLKKQRAKRIRN